MEEKVLFKNTTKLNENDVINFQKDSIKKISFIYGLVIFLICLGAGVGLYFVNSFLGIAMIVLGAVGGFAIFPYSTKTYSTRSNAENFYGIKSTNYYEFYQDEFIVKGEIADLESQKKKDLAEEKYKYEDVVKVSVIKNYICIFISKSQSFVLDKRGMTKGVCADLISFFKEKQIKVKEN